MSKIAFCGCFGINRLSVPKRNKNSGAKVLQKNEPTKKVSSLLLRK